MKTREDFETAEEYIAYLEAEQIRLRQEASAGNALRCKVSDKGAMSVYGLGRFPVTLYKGQWIRLFSQAPSVVAFLKAHDSELSEKPATIAKAA